MPRVSGTSGRRTPESRDSSPEISDSNIRRQKPDPVLRRIQTPGLGGQREYFRIRIGTPRRPAMDSAETVNRIFGIPKNRFTMSEIGTKFESSKPRSDVRNARSEVRDGAPALFRRRRRDRFRSFEAAPWHFPSKSESFVSNSESVSIEFESVISKDESYERNLTRVAGDLACLPGDLYPLASARIRLAPTRIQRSHR